MKKQFLYAILALLLSTPLYAQVQEDSDLFKDLKTIDSLLFEAGFNACDTSITRSLISNDLIFYHDQSGMQDKTQFLESIRKYICSNAEAKPIRKLIEGSLNVFPLYNNGKLYGAIQEGEHRFYIRTKGQPLRHTSTAKFTHTWLLKDEKWLLRNVLSYDHQTSE